MSKLENAFTPAKGLAGLKENFKHDIVAGFLVFLIALPLCLGIAMASGFPPVAGIMTAVIGGLLVSFIGGSDLAIKGPAAGLIVISIGAVETLGQGDMLLGYKLTLAVIVVSGILQVILGVLRSGILGDFFPSSSVHGMLAAIGIIIAAKQIHTAVGVKPEGKGPIELILEIPESIMNMNPDIAIIGGISLLILFLLPLIRNKYIKKIPAPMLVLLLAIPLGHYFGLNHTDKYLVAGQVYENGSEFLVTLPSDLSEFFTLPDFSRVFSSASIYFIVMFALVGSLETIISTRATELLDPFKRKSDMNKDLIGVGLANTLCGLVGALPMISEIVRSSANINNGARTKWSNFFHGAFLLAFVVFAPALLQQIPLAALAAMLIYTGFRLSSPKIFAEVYKTGPEQLLVFVITIVVILSTDLLLGIFAGILTEFILHLSYGAPLRNMFKSKVTAVKGTDNNLRIKVSGPAVFTNYIFFKKELDKLPEKHFVELDLAGCEVVDHSVMEHLYHFGEEYNRKGGNFIISGLESKKALSEHPLATKFTDKKSSSDSVIFFRRKTFADFAEKIGFSYTPFVLTTDTWFGSFSESRRRVKYIGNRMNGVVKGAQAEISDISVLYAGEMKARVFSLTVMVLEFPEGYHNSLRNRDATWFVEKSDSQVLVYHREKRLLSPEEIIQMLEFAGQISEGVVKTVRL